MGVQSSYKQRFYERAFIHQYKCLMTVLYQSDVTCYVGERTFYFEINLQNQKYISKNRFTQQEIAFLFNKYSTVWCTVS